MSGDRHPMLRLEGGRSGVEEGGAAAMGLRSGTLLAFYCNAASGDTPHSYSPPIPTPGPSSLICGLRSTVLRLGSLFHVKRFAAPGLPPSYLACFLLGQASCHPLRAPRWCGLPWYFPCTRTDVLVPQYLCGFVCNGEPRRRLHGPLPFGTF